MQISFYVLAERYAQSVVPNPKALTLEATSTPTDSASIELKIQADDIEVSEATLDFICRLTQTVLKKGEHALVIVDHNKTRLAKLDERLWSFEPSSFVAHNLHNDESLTTTTDLLTAPVTLLSKLPIGFDGVVLNLADSPLLLTTEAPFPERILEIISPDNISKQHGRDKYAHYRAQGFELTHHPIA